MTPVYAVPPGAAKVSGLKAGDTQSPGAVLLSPQQTRPRLPRLGDTPPTDCPLPAGPPAVSTRVTCDPHYTFPQSLLLSRFPGENTGTRRVCITSCGSHNT